MSTIRKLISAWTLALVGSLLLPIVSVAAVSGTTCDTPATTTTVSPTIAEHIVAVGATPLAENGLQRMPNCYRPNRDHTLVESRSAGRVRRAQPLRLLFE